MTTFYKTFDKCEDAVEAIVSTGFRYVGNFDPSNYNDFVHQCVNFYLGRYIPIDSSFYDAFHSFGLEINKYGTTASFDNGTAISIKLITPTDVKHYVAEIIFYKKMDKISSSREYKQLVSDGWTIATTDTYKANSNKKKNDKKSKYDRSEYDITFATGTIPSSTTTVTPSIE